MIIHLAEKTANLTARSYSITLATIVTAYVLVPSAVLMIYFFI
ncbi:hypothetical protein [Corynebacterium glutamicum]|nr:hypothetical protein [Corynebacterium glutamicum]